MDEAQKAVLAWMAIEERIAKKKSLKGMDKELALAMNFVKERGPVAAIELFEVSHMLKGDIGYSPQRQPAAPPKRYPRVIWKYHLATKGPMKDKKVKWTCTWEGMHLRVEHTTDQTGRVVFCGFIEEENVAAEKGLRLAQSAVEGKALERARSRDSAT